LVTAIGRGENTLFTSLVPEDLVQAIVANRCVAMVGLGLSRPAGSPDWEGLLHQMMGWYESHVAKLSNRDELEACIKQGDLLLVADELRELFDPSEFVSFMASVFKKKDLKPAAAHSLLTEVNFAAVLTTNYDNLLESAYTIASGGSKPLTFTHSDQSELSRTLNSGEFYILKMHGTADRISTIRMGTRDYRDLMHNNRNYRRHMSNIFSSKVVLFIGFGMRDPDLTFTLDELQAVSQGVVPSYYALMEETTFPPIKQRTFKRNYGIKTIPYKASSVDHPEVAEFLAELRDRTGKVRAQPPTAPLISTGLDTSDKLPRLREICELSTNAEIQKYVGKKYIEGLYVRRDIESVVERNLLGDDALANTLTRYREVIHANIHSTCEDLEKQIPKERRNHDRQVDVDLRKIESQLRTLRQLDRAIEEEFGQILAEGRPCDGKHRPAFSRLAGHLQKLSKLGILDSSQLGDALNIVRGNAAPVIMLIDRAGGGKTSLLCSMARRRRDANEIPLFVYGRFPVENEQSLLALVAQRLGWDGSAGSPEGYIKKVDEILSDGRAHITVYLDAINENRDIPRLNLTLYHTINEISDTRLRFVVTCRDMYWGFFENAQWQQFIAVSLKGNLYEFSSHEQESAIDKYFKFYGIEVELGREARKRCSHPLLLRFFCEAYGSKNGEHVNLGYRDDIRLKPLFDDYWKAKLAESGQEITRLGQVSAEQCIYSLVKYVFSSTSSVVNTEDFSKVTGVEDFITESSPYLRLLYEDVIIEEMPTGNVRTRRIIFVYEEFMEYAIARQIFFAHSSFRAYDLRNLAKALTDKMKKGFVNVLGVAEYLCAFCLDAQMFQTAFSLVSLLASNALKFEEEHWSTAVANVFTKYDQALDMILLNMGSDKNLRLILSVIGRVSRPVATEICSILGFRILFPHVIDFEIFRTRGIITLPMSVPKSSFETDRNLARRILSLIAECIVDFNMNPGRNALWKTWQGHVFYPGDESRRELARALWNLIGSSPRRSLLCAYASNGLFDSNENVRRAAALITRDTDNRVAVAIRAKVALAECDTDVRDLLQNYT
jgi:NAD-dependent SIR2 family protein deacetylase